MLFSDPLHSEFRNMKYKVVQKNLVQLYKLNYGCNALYES